MLKVGLVGAGFMAGVHALSWRKTPAELVGVYSTTADKTRSFAEEHHIRAYDSLPALIAAVDVVDICTPTPTHHPITLSAARAGRHIICEKPIARTVQQAQEMMDAAQHAGVHLLIAHVVRFFPEYTQAHTTVKQGSIGQVGVTRLKRAGYSPGISWYRDLEQSGGVLLDLMIHDFDFARWIAGDVVSVFARSIRSREPDANGDYALAILRHTSSAISHLEGSAMYPPPVFRTGFEIAGDQGLIEYASQQTAPVETLLHAHSGETAVIGRPQSPLIEDPYTTQIRHFYEVLVNNVVPRVTAIDALAALRIALAAIESAQTGRRVTLKEVH